MKTYLKLGIIGLIFISVTNCAVIPTCTGDLMPVIEVQINNTSSNHDDYINTSGFVPCRARIVNTKKVFNNNLNFPAGAEVEIRNKRLSTDLIVSSTSSGTAASFFATLPGNGDWYNFFIRGNSTTTIDKSNILEMATAGATCNEVVIARKGLMITSSPPISSTLPQVEIEVAGIATLDDYISWHPIYCKVKWLNPPTTTSTLNVTLRNMPSTDRLRFSDVKPPAGQTATSSTINLTLTGGEFTSFYIAGNDSNASIEDKDAVFEVLQGANLLAREGLMVRVRKNANTLSTNERDRYLEALREIHQTYNFYELFLNSHSRSGTTPFSGIAHLQAHRGSAFLPWHRAFVLHIERLLQSSDPSVALPYWHFDQSSPNMFNADFIGANPTAPDDKAIVNVSNPLSTWQITGSTVGITRRTPYGNTGIPSSVTGTGTNVATETATLALGNNYINFKGMEGTTHDGAHNNSGNTISWIAGSPSDAPQDPLFYFLHCNIDRLWGKWQWVNDRYDASQSTSYDLQGGHSASPSLPPSLVISPQGQVVTNRIYGQYVEDTMWPWDNKTGTSIGAGTTLERPTVAPLTPFPITLGGLMPLAMPTVGSTIDFRVLNYGYDDFYPY